MENFFITEIFDWKIRRTSNLDRILNLTLKRAGLRYRFRTAEFFERVFHSLVGRPLAPTQSGISTSVEQRINMYHFVSQVIAYDVEGDLVEIGCIDGQSAVLVQKLVEGCGSSKLLHVYDSFTERRLPLIGDEALRNELASLTPEDVVRRKFSLHGLRGPVIHKGQFEETLPTQLPNKIAFAHLDGDLYEPILLSLQHTYPRLAKGAICLINDYCDPTVYPEGWNYLPGVKKACDEFLRDKPERVAYIYSGGYSHGFFRKS
jgi:O-methyltransferase